jgi:hypothetical protein
VLVRYSPDGRYLLVQDPRGVYLLSHEPLHLLAYVGARDVYPLEFSADSKTLVSVGTGLLVTRARLPDVKKLEQKPLPISDGCLQSLLSPGGEFFVCLGPDFRLVVYQISTNKPVFSQPLQRATAPNSVVYVPLGEDGVFSSPFGYRLSNNWNDMVNRDEHFASLFFSSDGNTLFLNDSSESFRVELPSGKKTSLPAGLRKHGLAAFSALPDDQVLALGGEKDIHAAILSLKTGEPSAAPSFNADSARMASNPRYALLADEGAAGLRVFDLQQDRELQAPPNVDLDVFENEMAVVNERGNLFLYRVGEGLPFNSFDLPLDQLSTLRAAAVTPSLDEIAFAVNGSGAVFSLESGERLYSGPSFSSATFASSSSLYVLTPRSPRRVPRVLELNLSAGRSDAAWEGGKDLLRSAGPMLLEYRSENPFGPAMPQIAARRQQLAENDIPYRLRGLDPSSGKELWKREFSTNPPVPFADPQGERLVLAWNAKTEEARAAARRMVPAWEIYSHAQLNKLDSFFEVLDARSGATVGGVLVQQGSGPYSYDAAFSVGDALVLVKNGKRVSVFSLQSGNSIVRLVGGVPSASAQSRLLAIEEGPGLLSVYDLTTGAKLGRHLFSDPISYTHFSEDGNRLLVLTAYQTAYILDASAFRNAANPKTPNAPN